MTVTVRVGNIVAGIVSVEDADTEDDGDGGGEAEREWDWDCGGDGEYELYDGALEEAGGGGA
jgi:hypothetical protein